MAATDRILYYFPGSYFSCRALVGLFEKEITFKDHFVDILVGEQLTDSYLKINPKGLVPVLQDGDKIIAESDDIINYVDQTYTTGPILVPDMTTPLGQEVQEMREYLNKIRIEIVSYGILLNRQFSVSGQRLHPLLSLIMNKRSIAFKFSNGLKMMDAKLAQPLDPEMRELLLKKNAHDIDFRDTVLDADKLSRELDNLEPVFDRLEARLKSSRDKVGANDDYWLFGASFNAADVSVAILFFRLYQLGVDERYYSATKRPLVFAYNARLLKRPSVIKMRNMAGSSFRLMLSRRAKSGVARLVKTALVVGFIGLAGYAVWKFVNRNN